MGGCQSVIDENHLARGFQRIRIHKAEMVRSGLEHESTPVEIDEAGGMRADPVRFVDRKTDPAAFEAFHHPSGQSKSGLRDFKTF